MYCPNRKSLDNELVPLGTYMYVLNLWFVELPFNGINYKYYIGIPSIKPTLYPYMYSLLLVSYAFFESFNSSPIIKMCNRTTTQNINTHTHTCNRKSQAPVLPFSTSLSTNICLLPYIYTCTPYCVMCSSWMKHHM